VNVVDSSGWLEFYTDGANAAFFFAPIRAADQLVVPTISIFEVYRHFLRERGENDALKAATGMRAGIVVDLDHRLATAAATFAHVHKLAMADSIIFATAREFGATLWTQDADFADMPGVKYRAKAK
jgi:toxin FitB